MCYSLTGCVLRGTGSRTLQCAASAMNVILVCCGVLSWVGGWLGSECFGLWAGLMLALWFRYLLHGSWPDTSVMRCTQSLSSAEL